MNASSNPPAASGVFFLIGFMGSGKTHWGNIWARANHLNFIDLDQIIEQEAGATIAEIFNLHGEAYFRKLEARVLRTCSNLKGTIIACGGGTPCFFDNIRWMNENGHTIYISCKPGELLQRLIPEKDKRPLLAKLTGEAMLTYIEQKLVEREPFYLQAKQILPSGALSVETFATTIINTNG